MGAVRNHRTSVEVLTKSPGKVRDFRTSVEVLTKQRGKVRDHRTSVEVLIDTRGKVRDYRTYVEALIPTRLMEMFWGIPLNVIPPIPTGLMLDFEAGVETLQTVGGSGAVATNDPVGSWGDKQSTRVASQGTAGARPLLIKAAYNGQDALRFDGGDDQLVLPGIPADEVPNVTVFVVAKATSAGGRMMFCKSHTVSGWSSPYHRYGWYNNGSFYSVWNGVGTNTNAWTSGDLKVIELCDGKGYANGTLVTNGSDADLTYPIANTPFLISGNGVGSERWHGDICRIMVWNRSLDASERALVRAMLGLQYGVTVI